MTYSRASSSKWPKCRGSDPLVMAGHGPGRTHARDRRAAAASVLRRCVEMGREPSHGRAHLTRRVAVRGRVLWPVTGPSRAFRPLRPDPVRRVFGRRPTLVRYPSAPGLTNLHARATPTKEIRHGHGADANDPKRGPGGPQRRRQDDTGRGTAAPGRRRPPLGPGRRGHDGVRHRTRGDQARHLAVPGDRPLSLDGLGRPRVHDQPDRHPRVRRLRGRGGRRPRGRRPRTPRGQRCDGVEVGTEIVWQQCAELGIPRMVFLTKEDKPRADFHRVLDQMRAAFGGGLVPLEIPLGEEEAFHGVADVLSDTGFGYGGEGQHHTEPIPDDVAAEEQRVHDEVAEEIVSGDDEQLERYLSGEVPSATELERALVHEVRECAEFPVLVGSALTGVGVDRLADYLCELGPSPADRPATVHAGKLDGPATEVDANPEGDPLLYVFRTVADPFVGQVSLFKVLSGTVANEDRLINAVTGTEERLHGLFKLRGKEHLAVERIAAGDIGAVAKLAATPTGSTLAKRGMTVHVTGTPPRPTPYALALNPLTQADDDKLSSALQRLVGEDPTLVIDRSVDSGQTILRGTGDTHIAVALERLSRKFGVNVSTEEVRIPYRETIARKIEAEGKLKKQSGGHGQFAVCQLRVSPVVRGEGTSFVDRIVGGSIPRNYIPAVEKGVFEAMTVSYTHLRAHETRHDLVCRLLLEK